MAEWKQMAVKGMYIPLLLPDSRGLDLGGQGWLQSARLRDADNASGMSDCNHVTDV